jgi:GMP synthase (glutamine-hydrolysing)
VPQPLGPLLVVEHETDAGLDLMAAQLGSGVELVRPYLGDRVPEIWDYAGLVVLGGAMGAWDDEVAPWLPATRRLLADAVRQELPTLGICLGGQLLAAACGGTVERGADGLELGLVPVTALPAADTDPFFDRIGRAVCAPAVGPEVGPATGTPWLVSQYHRDAVTRLPPDAELIVSADRYPVQGFRVGPAAWGVQYHPEVSTAAFARWLTSGQQAGELPDGAVSVLAAIQDGEPARLKLAAAHSTAFLDLVNESGELAVAQ